MEASIPIDVSTLDPKIRWVNRLNAQQGQRELVWDLTRPVPNARRICQCHGVSNALDVVTMTAQVNVPWQLCVVLWVSMPARLRARLPAYPPGSRPPASRPPATRARLPTHRTPPPAARHLLSPTACHLPTIPCGLPHPTPGVNISD